MEYFKKVARFIDDVATVKLVTATPATIIADSEVGTPSMPKCSKRNKRKHTSHKLAAEEGKYGNASFHEPICHDIYSAPTMPAWKGDMLGRMVREDACRGDQLAMRLHIRQQRRAKENEINQANRGVRTLGHIYREELDEQEHRSWHERDHLTHPIKFLD